MEISKELARHCYRHLFPHRRVRAEHARGSVPLRQFGDERRERSRAEVSKAEAATLFPQIAKEKRRAVRLRRAAEQLGDEPARRPA